MPRQGETFINAIGVEVQAHGGSTPSAPDHDAARANAIPPPDGVSVDVLGRQYDDRIPPFLSTGTEFVIDRLHSKQSTKRNRGGNVGRYLTFASLQRIAEDKGHSFGDNEFGLPPSWWSDANPGYGEAIQPGYGDGGSPYGPEWGADAPQQAAGWTQIGPNSYEFNAPPGTQWRPLGFDQPKDTPMRMTFTVTVFENMEVPDMIFRFDESSEDGAVPIDRLGYYDFEFTSPAGDPRSRFVCRGPEPWSPLPARLVIENIVMRSLAPPSYVGGVAIEGPLDAPGFLTINPGEWAGGDQFRYEWRRGGVDPVISTNDRIQTFFEDSEATFTCDVWCSNPVGETGPERATVTLEEFGALANIGFDFSDFTTMFQDRAGTVPVTQMGDRIARINGTGLTLLAPDDGDSRPTVVNVNGIGAAQHIASFQQHLTTGAVGSLIIDGNTVSLFYVFQFDSDLDANEGAFSLGSSVFGSDWQQPETIVTWLTQQSVVGLYRGDSSVPNGQRPCIMETETGVGGLVMIEYHCSPTENRVLVNGAEAPPEWFSDNNPTATPLQVDYITTAGRLQSTGVLALFGDVTFCEFQFQANMPVEDQDQLRADLLTKWGISP